MKFYSSVITGACAAALFLASGRAQTTIDLRTQGRTVDFSGASATIPAKVGLVADLPPACKVGEHYFAKDVVPGSNVYYCTASNTWTPQTAGGTGGSGGLITQMGAGAVPRTVNSAHQDTINVRDFGATCDANGGGGHDDTAAFRAAVASRTGGVNIHIPATPSGGGCLITDTILITKSGVTFEGESAIASLILFDPSGPGKALFQFASDTFLNDASLDAGALTLTSASANFTPADLFKLMVIAGAASNVDGIPQDFNAQILTVVDAHTVTIANLDGNAVHNVTGAAVHYGSEIFAAGVKNLTLSQLNGNQPKIGINLTDVSVAKIENVTIFPWFDTTTHSSIGLQTMGRDSSSVVKFTCNADIPISIERNPHYDHIDLDHFSFYDLYLLPYITRPNVWAREGTTLTNSTWSGYQAWVGGDYGLLYKNTTYNVTTPQNLLFENVRWEHPDSVTHHEQFHIELARYYLNGLIIRNSLTTAAKGIFLRTVQNPTIQNYSYTGGGTALDVDNTVAGLVQLNNNFGAGTVNDGGATLGSIVGHFVGQLDSATVESTGQMHAGFVGPATHVLDIRYQGCIGVQNSALTDSLPLLCTDANGNPSLGKGGFNTILGSAIVTTPLNTPGNVVTVDGAQTLRNKSIDAIQLTTGTLALGRIPLIPYANLTGTPAALPPGGAASGDLSGAYPAPTVARLQGRPVSAAAPSAGQALLWSAANADWEPSSVVGGGGALNYAAAFTAQTTVTVTGATHALGTPNLIVSCYDASTPALHIEPDTISINPVTYDVVIVFTSPQSGRCVLNGSSLTSSVASVFGRTGAITAQSGDYTFAQISGTVGDSQVAAGISAAKIGSGTVSNTALGYLANVTGDVQTQLDAKAGASHSHTLSGDVSGDLSATSVTRLRGRTVSAAAPSAGQALVWNAANADWEPSSVAGVAGGGSGANYAVTFGSQTTVTVPGAAHALGTSNLIVSCYDSSTPAQAVDPDTVSVNPSTFDVSIGFSAPQSGKCVINGSGGGAPMTNSAVLSFPSIANGACSSDQTLSVAGAALGDTVAPGWPAGLEPGLIGMIRVTAANTVSVRLCNLSGAAITPNSATFRATVVRSF